MLRMCRVWCCVVCPVHLSVQSSADRMLFLDNPLQTSHQQVISDLAGLTFPERLYLEVTPALRGLPMVGPVFDCTCMQHSYCTM